MYVPLGSALFLRAASARQVPIFGTICHGLGSTSENTSLALRLKNEGLPKLVVSHRVGNLKTPFIPDHEHPITLQKSALP